MKKAMMPRNEPGIKQKRDQAPRTNTYRQIRFPKLCIAAPPGACLRLTEPADRWLVGLPVGLLDWLARPPLMREASNGDIPCRCAFAHHVMFFVRPPR
jgi:hypothetical protein